MKVLLFSLIFPLYSFANCFYEIDKTATTLKWTGYKFSNKTPVSGSFNSVQITSKKAYSFAKLLTGTQVAIKTKSFESKNLLRNKNIIKNLFNKVVSGEQIIGKVQSVDSRTNKVRVEINWGETKSLISFDYEMKDGFLNLSQAVDILKLGQKEAYQSFEKSCKTQHRGTDKKVVSYSEVLIEIKAKLKTGPSYCKI